MKYSKYQKAIFKYVKTGKGNCIINAVAGSGKTTTIVESLNIIPKGSTALFCAFNKAIVKTLQVKVQNPKASIKTLHSIGYMILTNTFGRPKLDNWKVKKIIDGMSGIHYSEKSQQQKDYDKFLKNMVNLAKLHLVDNAKIFTVLDKFAIDYSMFDKKQLVKELKYVLKENNKDTTNIDFNDMIYLPLVKKDVRFPTYDFIFCDEVQDFTKIQMELITLIAGKKTRVIMVGDPKQSIYQFAGAHSDAINVLKKHFKAKELPLSITYRCPKSHVKLAQEFVPYIEAAKDAIEGSIEETSVVSEIQDGDLILCRLNNPLSQLALLLICEGKKPIIRGADIGKSIITLIKKQSCYEVEELIGVVTESLRNATIKMHMDDENKARHAHLIDMYNTILVLSYDMNTIAEIMTRIKGIFSDENKGIVLSSIHRAKGLEADNVYILNRELMPHPLAKSKWALAQEDNLIYVAYTRSKNKLTFISEETQQ